MDRSTSSRLRLINAAAIAVLITAQAVLAGRYLSLGDDLIVTHGYLGNAVFVLTIVNLIFALRSKPTGVDFGLAVALVVGTFAQIGLGYVGRDSIDAAAWHIPNGVLLMGLSAFQLSEARRH